MLKHIANQFHIMKSSRKNKKYMAMFKDGKVVHFGDTRYEDFTVHKDEERKRLYLLRHKKNEDWNNPYSAGSLSRYILWNKPTINDSVEDFKKKFNL